MLALLCPAKAGLTSSVDTRGLGEPGLALYESGETKRWMKQMRTAQLDRSTSETKISVTLNLDGTGVYDNQTGIGFLTICWISCRAIR